LILAANGKGGLYTCALRPHSIYGPGDDLSWPQMLASAAGGKLKWKLTEDKHKSSYTFLDNIVHAEILAADRLMDPSVRASVAGKAFNINDDIEALFWTKCYDVGELSGVPRSQYGKMKVPFFGLLYFISWIFWRLGFPLGNFTPYVLCLATTTHTYSCARAKKDLGYATIMSHEERWKITKESFKNWKSTYKPKKTPKLSWWLTVISLLMLTGTYQCFTTNSMAERQFTLQPDQVTPLAGRLYGIWALTAGLLRLSCAWDLNNANIFKNTLRSFYVGLGFFIFWKLFGMEQFPLTQQWYQLECRLLVFYGCGPIQGVQDKIK